MTKAPIKTETNRLLYHQNNSVTGITLVCFCGIHGNEPAGFYGVQKVINELIDKQVVFNGNFYALLGNVKAINSCVRFHDLDLNRLWSKEDIDRLKGNSEQTALEKDEQSALYSEIKSIFDAHNGPFVFIDLHTTSSPTVPFITISDSLNNRSLAKKFNVPIVLGIEEFIDGPLLTYLNEFGHISLGFEAGQHQDKKSIVHSEAFVWLIMKQLGLLKESDFQFEKFHKILNFDNGFFEIIYRYSPENIERFEMLPGFNNFDAIIIDQEIAQYKNTLVRSKYNGLIFMPMYQKKGEDGFFIVNKISTIWLFLSSILRGLKFHELLRILPGIKRHPENEYSLIANKQIAFLLTTKVFHLFGYRKKIKTGKKIHFIKRDRKVSTFI